MAKRNGGFTVYASNAGVEAGRVPEECDNGRFPRLRVLYLPSWYPRPDHPTYAIFLRVQAEALAKWHDLLVVPMPSPVSLLGPPRNWMDRCEVRRGSGEFSELYIKGPNYTPRFPDARERTVMRLYRRGFHEATRFLGAPPDLIHAQVSLEAGYFAARLASQYNCPLVLTEQISRPELMLRTPRDRKWFRRAMNAPECVIALSSMQRNLLYKAGVQREIDVVPNLVDTDFFSPGHYLSPPPYRLIAVGNLIRRKGFHLLLDAVAQLNSANGFHFMLDIVGKGECKESLEGQAVSLGIAKQVRLHGEKSQQEIRDLLRQSHIFVSSSLTESLGVAVIEAMSVGLPVVVTRSGGPESFVTSAQGALVEAGSSAELARGIEDVVSRLDKFDVGEQHQYAVNRFGEDIVVREITKRYLIALERHKRNTSEIASP